MSTPEVIRVYTFPAGFGLPTTGPLTLKLIMALRMANVRYELVYDGDLRKSPKRKVPWIEAGSLAMADSALILDWLAKTCDVDLEQGLTPLDRARGLALRVLLEEHWHQVFEIELILDPQGAGAALAALQDHMKHHLYERGMYRHDRNDITRFGKADLDAVAAWLDGRAWSIADRPTLTDCTVWGLLAPAVYAPFATPCMAYARTLRPIVAFIERARAKFFPELEPSGAARELGISVRSPG
jgi:glutathione S-transferase